MRVWSLHPALLDAKGLVALWREALLAQKVLAGATRGYRQHPQLTRFRSQADPVAAVAAYLYEVWQEAGRRGYRFDGDKIAAFGAVSRISVTQGQIRYEFEHLKRKLALRDPLRLQRVAAVEVIPLHPLFVEISGEIESWEVVTGAGRP